MQNRMGRERKAIFEDSVDFRSCGPQLFNHKVKLPARTIDTRGKSFVAKRQIFGSPAD